MSTYTIAGHQVLLENDGQYLEVRTSSGSWVARWNLSVTNVKFSVNTLDEYVVETGSLSPAFSVPFELGSEDSSLIVDGKQMIGITDLRIEGREQVTYHLAICAVYLSFSSSTCRVTIDTPCNPPCEEPQGGCLSIVTLP